MALGSFGPKLVTQRGIPFSDSLQNAPKNYRPCYYNAMHVIEDRQAIEAGSIMRQGTTMASTEILQTVNVYIYTVCGQRETEER